MGAFSPGRNQLFGLCQFCHKKWGGREGESKKVWIFRKKHMHTGSWLPNKFY